MKTNHLLESEIQQFSIDQLSSEPHVIDHIQSCAACREKAETYQLIFTAIKDQPEPTFNFDLTELVMEQLPVQKATFSTDKTVVYIIALLTIFAVGFAFFFFRVFLVEILKGIAPMLIYLVITCTFGLFLFFGFDMLNDYNKKLKILNFY